MSTDGKKSNQINVFSCTTTPIVSRFGDTQISSATGYFYLHNDIVYLITNWHVVTGRHADSFELIDKKYGGIPDNLVVHLPVPQVRGFDKPVFATVKAPYSASLYEDSGKTDTPEMPIWLCHPKHRSDVDVVAIPLPVEPDDKPIFRAIAINCMKSIPDLELAVATSVFVLGHPLGIGSKTATKLPIWKRASVASEPDLLWEGRPCFLIDTATRKGMSGAPVIAWHRGLGYPRQGGQLGGLTISGGRFLGTYSSRWGNDEFLAQLGRVWLPSVIDEIIEGGEKGISSFHLDLK